MDEYPDPDGKWIRMSSICYVWLDTLTVKVDRSTVADPDPDPYPTPDSGTVHVTPYIIWSLSTMCAIVN